MRQIGQTRTILLLVLPGLLFIVVFVIISLVIILLIVFIFISIFSIVLFTELLL